MTEMQTENYTHTTGTGTGRATTRILNPYIPSMNDSCRRRRERQKERHEERMAKGEEELIGVEEKAEEQHTTAGWGGAEDAHNKRTCNTDTNATTQNMHARGAVECKCEWEEWPA